MDSIAIRQDRSWLRGAMPQLQPGSRALGTAPGIWHQPGTRDGPGARVGTQMGYKTVFEGRFWYSYSLKALEEYPHRQWDCTNFNDGKSKKCILLQLSKFLTLGFLQNSYGRGEVLMFHYLGHLKLSG